MRSAGEAHSAVGVRSIGPAPLGPRDLQRARPVSSHLAQGVRLTLAAKWQTLEAGVNLKGIVGKIYAWLLYG